MARNDLTQQTKKDLLLLARQAGLTGVTRLSKAELIARLRQALPKPSSSAAAATVPEVTPDNLSIQTHRSLQALAKKIGLTGVGRLRKADLLTRLATVMTAQSTPAVSISSHTATEPEPAIAITVQPVEEVQPDSPENNSHPPEPVSSPPPSAAALPSGYDDNRFVLLARDPHWLYAYWDFSTEEIRTALTKLGSQEVCPILRVFDVTYLDFNGTNAWHSIDIALTPFATTWYIPVSQPDASYCVEMGYQSPDGRFVALGRSNVVSTPRDGVSPDTTLHWQTPPGKQPSALPSSQSQPVPLTTTERSGLDRQALPSSPSVPSSAEHPSSWSASRGAGPTHVRSGTLVG
ncbi:MAG: DUF4912 domain-containing protein [Deltaproteobacteria bacterium]|nr:DUF4912 domain-containing protein [Deltaproteobacteria bacterium]